jgi:hypothetical protein
VGGGSSHGQESRQVFGIHLLPVIDDLGIKNVIEQVGIDRVIEEVGLERVAEEVNLKRVLDKKGVAWLLKKMSLTQQREMKRRLQEI